nr:NADP-dependent oxidoreductase [Dactylosporangium thailandense]
MTDQMKAVIQDVLGGPEVLHVADVPRPTPSIGEVLVKVSAAGVNPVDAMNRQFGLFAGPPPFILGFDVSGVVHSVGAGVTLYRPGDEVFGLLPFPNGAGAYAEYVLAPTRALVPKPSRLSHEEAAALPLAGLTAWQALVDTAKATAGSRVFITGAAGGVGHLAVQIAHARGAHVTALAKADDASYLKRLGADVVVDYVTTDFTETVRDLDIVLDVLGGDVLRRAIGCVKPGGRVVTTLPQSLPEATPTAAEAGVRLSGLFVEADQVGLHELVSLVDAGHLRPTVAATHPLADAAHAHSEPHRHGKVVLVP